MSLNNSTAEMPRLECQIAPIKAAGLHYASKRIPSLNNIAIKRDAAAVKRAEHATDAAPDDQRALDTYEIYRASYCASTRQESQ